MLEFSSTVLPAPSPYEEDKKEDINKEDINKEGTNNEDILAESVGDDVAISTLQQDAAFHASFKHILHKRLHLSVCEETSNRRQPERVSRISTKQLQQTRHISPATAETYNQ